LFDDLDKLSSKINYNKNWDVKKLKAEQLSYSAYDVMYLYDLLDKITNSIRPLQIDVQIDVTKQSSIDPISLVNRLYRFHMLTKLNILDLSAECKVMATKYGLTKDNMSIIDQKIMETPLTKIIYTDLNSQIHELDVTIGDVLSIDTIRKSILNVLRIFQINKSSNDIRFIEEYFVKSDVFLTMKGHNSIQELTVLIKPTTNKINVTCRTIQT
jgi:hypothetical protein